MKCPACGSETWNNAERVAGGWKGPLHKCKNQDCGWVQWPPKPEKAKPTPKGPAPIKPAPSGSVDWAQVQRDYTAALYTAAHAMAKALGCAVTDVDQQAIQAGAATIIISLKDRGYVLGTLAPPKPTVPKPPTVEELSEVPAPLREPGEEPY